MKVQAILATISEKIKQEEQNKAFKMYVAECLRVITENTAMNVGGSYISIKFSEILDPPSVDNRSGEEIVAEIVKKAGLKVI